MTSTYITEDMVEKGALDLLCGDWVYATASGPDIAPEGDAPERSPYQQVVLEGRLSSYTYQTQSNPTHSYKIRRWADWVLFSGSIASS